MVVQAYAVCIGVTPECRRTESEMIGDGRGCVDEVDEAYHDITPLLCLYVSEWHSAPLMLGAARCNWRERRRGGGGIGVRGGESQINSAGMGVASRGATRDYYS